MSNKVHAVGDRMIGNHARTACNTYMAEGRYAVTTCSDPALVTCANCRKKLDRAEGTGGDRDG